MKILLVNCTSDSDMGFWPPLGLGYVGSTLQEDGHSVQILDRSVLFRKLTTMSGVDIESQKILATFMPDLVGIGATTPLLPDALHVASLVKSHSARIQTILGGQHATILPEETLKNSPDFDLIAIGEAEATMRELCKNPSQYASVPGICYRDGDKIGRSASRSMIESVDDIPFPARHLFNMKEYLKSSASVIRGVECRATHIFTSRGCPFKCSFCAGSVVFDRKVRFHSADYVIREIEHLLTTYPNLEGLYFAEDMFTANKERVISVCEKIIERQIHKKLIWCAQLRVNNLDRDVLVLMRKAGCVQVEFGLESGSQKILDYMEKHATVAQNYAAVKLAHDCGLRVLGDIIVGMPGETREDFMETIRLIETTKPDYVGFNRFIPLPGSKIFDTLAAQKKINPDWTKYHVGGSNNQDINLTAMKDNEFNSLYAHYRYNLIKPIFDRNYLKYNIFRHPLRMLWTMFLFAAKSPKTIIQRILKIAGQKVHADVA